MVLVGHTCGRADIWDESVALDIRLDASQVQRCRVWMGQCFRVHLCPANDEGSLNSVLQCGKRFHQFKGMIQARGHVDIVRQRLSPAKWTVTQHKAY